ncbi:hypothetical protein KIPB_011714, partial [Kipferlia bialata]
PPPVAPALLSSPQSAEELATLSVAYQHAPSGSSTVNGDSVSIQLKGTGEGSALALEGVGDACKTDISACPFINIDRERQQAETAANPHSEHHHHRPVRGGPPVDPFSAAPPPPQLTPVMTSHLRIIYGKHAHAFEQRMHDIPLIAVPIIATRLEAHAESLARQKRTMQQKWLEDEQEFYLKSLDKESSWLKQNDKRYTSPQMLTDDFVARQGIARQMESLKGSNIGPRDDSLSGYAKVLDVILPPSAQWTDTCIEGQGEAGAEVDTPMGNTEAAAEAEADGVVRGGQMASRAAWEAGISHPVSLRAATSEAAHTVMEHTVASLVHRQERESPDGEGVTGADKVRTRSVRQREKEREREKERLLAGIETHPGFATNYDKNSVRERETALSVYSSYSLSKVLFAEIAQMRFTDMNTARSQRWSRHVSKSPSVEPDYTPNQPSAKRRSHRLRGRASPVPTSALSGDSVSLRELMGLQAQCDGERLSPGTDKERDTADIRLPTGFDASVLCLVEDLILGQTTAVRGPHTYT